MNTLNLLKRDLNLANNAKKLRKQGKIPGIIYGEKNKQFMFEVSELELGREISKSGEHGIIDFNINGKNQKALIKDVQRDPVTHKILHLDLKELNENEKIISNVPLYYEGEDYLNKNGMVLQKEKDSIKVECNSEDLPKYIKLNVNELNNGYVYRVGDLEVANEISIIDSLDMVVASISYERKKVSDDMEEIEKENNK